MTSVTQTIKPRFLLDEQQKAVAKYHVTRMTRHDLENQMFDAIDRGDIDIAEIPFPDDYPELETKKLPPGTMVFPWNRREPWWVVKWQEHNGIGGSYWIVDASGNNGCVGVDEITRQPAT